MCSETSSRLARENELNRHLLEVAQQFGQGDLKTGRQHFEDAQASLPAPILQLGDVDAANS